MPSKKITYNLDLQQNQIKNVSEPDDLADVATKSYVDTGLTAKANASTTLSGYGITDALNTSATAQTKAGALTVTGGVTASLTGNASTATTLQTGRDISLTGDVTGTATGFNGSANASISTTLANSGVSAGTYSSVTVNTKGIVTAASNPTSDAHAATAISYSNGAVNGVAFPTSPNGTPNNVQLAIENLFQYANSGKTQIANAIGSPATASDSFSTLAGYISTLGSKTYGVTKSVVFDESINKDEAIKSYYKSLTPLKLANPNAPTNAAVTSAGDIAISDNGYIAIGTNVTPFHALYFQSGDTITKLADIASGLPTGATNGIALSTNATYLAMAHTAGTFLKIYKRRGDEFTNTGISISANPTSAGRACAFSNDNQFLAVGHGYSGAPLQSLTVYQRTGDTFTKLTISEQPTDDVYGVSWSSDGTYLACAHFTSPFFTIYKRSGTTFTKLSVSGGNPTGNAYRVSISPDDTYVAVAHTTSPFVTVYKRSGDTFNKLADSVFNVSAGNTCRSIAWSPNGVYLGVGIGSGNYQIVYKCINDNFTKQSDPSTFPTGTANGFAWSYDAEYYAVAHTTSPFISIYKNSSSTYLFRKVNPSGTASISRFDKAIGLAQETGIAGQTKNASILTGGSLL